MTSDVLTYAGSIMIALWGIAHIVPTRSIVKGFGAISEENKHIITMEWVMEGLTLVFIGSLGLIITVFGDAQDPVSIVVYRTSAVMLILMAGWSSLTGARIAIIPMKICPFVKTAAAILLLLGSIL